MPDQIPDGEGTQSKEQFLEDVYYGVKASTMSLRITQVNHSPFWVDSHADLVQVPTSSAASIGRILAATRFFANSSPENHCCCQIIQKSTWTLLVREMTRLLKGWSTDIQTRRYSSVS